MTYPITPPPELVQQWVEKSVSEHDPGVTYSLFDRLATQAAQWGADQELETILEMVGVGQQLLPEEDRYLDGLTVASIRAARRPKPPSLKEVALEDLRSIELLQKEHKMVACTFNIRRALERLKELEGQ